MIRTMLVGLLLTTPCVIQFGCGCGGDGGLWQSAGGSLMPCAIAGDLNANGLLDADDIASGRSADVNGNGIVDEIEIDADGDGALDGRVLAGRAWQDLEGDGLAGPSDPSLAGITVRALGEGGVLLGETTTDADGRWRLDGLATNWGVLIQYDGWPEGLTPTLGVNDMASAERLVRGSTIAADFGLRRTTRLDVRGGSADIRLATPCYIAGAATSNDPALVSFPYGASGIAARYGGTGPDPQPDAAIRQIASTWGLDYQEESGRLFASTFLRRHVGLGVDGLGAIYAVQYDANRAAASIQSFDMQGVTPANVGDAVSGNVPIDVGSVQRTGGTDYEISPSTILSIDLDAFRQVARVGFGDMDLDESGRALWVVNLFQRSLVRIDVRPGDRFDATTSDHVTSYRLERMGGLPVPPQHGAGQPSGEILPWAISFHGGRGYVGCVATAEYSQDPADLRAWILSFDPDDPASGLRTEVVLDDLTYPREPLSELPAMPVSPTRRSEWQAWADEWAQTGYGVPTGSRSFFFYPQPVLSDIDFTDDGDMVIALADRFSFQFGYNQYLPVAGYAGSLHYGLGAGDLLQAFRTGSGWVLEGSDPLWVAPDGGGFDSLRVDDGPFARGEHYWMDSYNASPSGNGTHHGEVSLGAVAVLPGSTEVVSTVYDPVSRTNSNGMHWYSEADGVRTQSYQMLDYRSGFAKTAGIGDLALIGDPAPIEIGNQVFFDGDRTGLQSGSDRGVAGVKVVLRYQGAIVACTTTDANGRYAFRSGELRLADGSPAPHVLRPLDDHYSVGIDLESEENRRALRGGVPTAPSAGNDALDSDGETTIRDGWLEAPVRTPGVGRVDASFDFGFMVDCETLTR